MQALPAVDVALSHTVLYRCEFILAQLKQMIEPTNPFRCTAGPTLEGFGVFYGRSRLQLSPTNSNGELGHGARRKVLHRF